MNAKTQQKPVTLELQSPLDGYMRVMFTHTLAAMARSLRNENLSLPQLAALHLIELRGEMRVGDLGAELALPMPAASRLASDLVDRGLLERREDQSDRRAKVISLSRAGRKLMEAVIGARVAEALAAMSTIEGPVSERFKALFADLSQTGLGDAPPGPERGDEKP